MAGEDDLELARLRAEARRRALALQIANAQRQQSTHSTPEANPAPEIMTALGRGAANMGTAGFADNILGGMAVVAGRSPDGASYGDYSDPGASYTAMRDRARADLAESREAQPGATLTGELLGGIGGSLGLGRATAGLLSRAIPGAGRLATAGRFAGAGGIEGGLLGAGLSDAQAWGDLAKGTAQMGAVGAGLGLLAPAAVALGRAVADPVVGAVKAIRGLPYEGRAARTLAATFQRAGMTPEAAHMAILQAANEGQDVFRTADALGNSGQRALAGVARQPGEGRQEIADYLRQRQLDQADRVAGFTQDALDVQETAEQANRRLGGADYVPGVRGEEAAALYGNARRTADPVNLNRALFTIDSLLRRNPGLDNSTTLAMSPAGKRLLDIRARMASDTEQLIDFNDVLDLHEEIGRTMRANPQASGDLRPVYQALDAALAEASNHYSLANRTYALRSREIEAIDQGREAAGARYQDTADAFGSLPAPELSPLAERLPNPFPDIDPQQAFRTGYGDERLRRIEASTEGRNTALPFTTTRDGQVMGLLSTDPALFQRQIRREMTMADTNVAALGGSRTADNEADKVDMNGTAQGLGVLTNILAGRYGAAGADMARAIASAGTGMNEETRTLIARVLLSDKPQEAMRGLLDVASREGSQSRAAEAFLRHIGYAAADNRLPQ